jgi:glycosyltransferase involved in cell wall biosynthesis
MIWHVLDVRAVWIKEFAAALSKQVSTIGWLPKFGAAGVVQNHEEEFAWEDPQLTIRAFPLQRGFARFPVSLLAQEKKRIVRRLAERAGRDATGPIICTSPHYAGVAEEWQGPVIYYVTDFFPAYRDEPEFIRSLDLKMTAAATLVCPNSQRVADYLRDRAECPPDKIVIIPNATRGANVMPTKSLHPSELPREIADLPRPVAGVIGNLAENTDWVLLHEAIERTPWLSWVFVGPTDMGINDPEQSAAREFLLGSRGRIRFVGEKPYGELRDYARALDVAILPYQKREPTYSGSSTRFYEHLAACRPMIATRGFEELLHKEPLLRLTNTSEEMVAALEHLRSNSFIDGYEELRRTTSARETWENRASQMIAALSARRAIGREAAA